MKLTNTVDGQAVVTLIFATGELMYVVLFGQNSTQGYDELSKVALKGAAVALA